MRLKQATALFVLAAMLGFVALLSSRCQAQSGEEKSTLTDAEPKTPADAPAPSDDTDKPADATAEDTADDTTRATEPDQTAAQPEEKEEVWPFGAPKGATLLSPKGRIWFHGEKKMVIVDGRICLREGQLEMFACSPNSKEHESVVAICGKPSIVHAGLLAVGAIAGHPVQFDPMYVPATGTPVDIYALWKDEKGERHQRKAQEWIRSVKTQKPMEQAWVFGGSGFWTDEETGRRYYHADGGDFICVSNFATATLDLPMESSQTNEALMFEALTENIPALGTKVRLVLVPRQPKKAGDDVDSQPEP